MKTTTLPLKHWINRAPYRLALVFPLALACFALAPQARAVCRQGCDVFHSNTFLGADALLSNTSGESNTAIGGGALTSNTTGFDNTANGSTALFYNTSGYANTANGAFALFLNTSGSDNTAVGTTALTNNTTGDANTAVGVEALRASTGKDNTALGFLAGQNLTGDNNIALGSLAGQYLLGNNNIDIGNQGGADDSGVIRIGTEGTHTATYIAGIRQTPLTNGGAVGVGITADGQLGVRPSSARFKEAIKPMDNVSKAIFSLQPVTFRYKNDPAALPQFGLVAEEVAKVNSDLVARDKEGKPFTVRYDEIDAMLLNEFLKEHREVQELKKQIAALTAGLQKVSAELELRKSAPQTVKNQ
jgi:Chaperone of endosialidase